MKASVIISTYNSETWLKKVLLGYAVQTERDFEIVIADDGSTQKTRELIYEMTSQFLHPIKHVWQEDLGFRKCMILNKAILESKSDYLIFTDGDCIPRKDFVSVHLVNKQKGYFLSGGYLKLNTKTSDLIQKKEILSNECFTIRWLFKNGVNVSFKLTKLVQIKWFSSFMNWITPTKSSWNGHNASGFKKDILAVNGFNEALHYGGEDREMGERLFNLGLFSKQIRYSAVCLHLHHERNYVDDEKIKINWEVRQYNKKHQVTWIDNGIIKPENKV